MARLGRSRPATLYGHGEPFSVIYSVPEQLWYALFDTTTGELLSLGAEVPEPLAGADYVVLGRQPDESMIWDATLRLFVPRPLDVLIDRVSDLVGDPGLASAWAALTTEQSLAMQARIALMLGPHRYRFDFQPVDLEAGFGA